MQKTLKTRLFTILLIFLMCIGFMAPAHAYELVYIQTSIDPAQWEILGSVIQANVPVSRHSPEFRRIPDTELAVLTTAGNSVGEFNASRSDFTGIQGLKDHLAGDLPIANKFAQAGLLTNLGWFNEENRILSFPTNQVKRDDSTPEQFEEALKINNELVMGLNQAFNAYITEKGYEKTDDAGAYLDKMIEFLSHCSNSGSCDKCSVIDDEYKFQDNGKDVSVKWKMRKSDKKWISWGAIVYEAFYNYCLEGEEAVTAGNVYTDITNENILVTGLVWVFSLLINGVRSMLGLWSLDELMFNEGLRQASYIAGIFPAAWEPTMWTLFTVFEIFGAAILMIGVIVSVVHKLLSTTNFIERMHLMERIQDLIICAVVLALLPFALRVIMSLCNSLTQICYSWIPTDASGKPRKINYLIRHFTAGNKTLAGIVGQCMSLGLEIYFNFYYAIRSFSVLVLIIMSPIFICGICLSPSKKQQAMQWSRELLAFIVMQPIHAFCMALMLILQTSNHAFDNIVILYALIPLSQTIKSLLVGHTSGFAEQAADRAKRTATGLTAAVGMGALTAGVSGIASKIVGGSVGKGGGNGSNDPGSSDPGNSDPGSNDPAGNSSPMGNASSGGIPGKVVSGIKSGAANVGHMVSNSRVGQGVKKAANTSPGRAVVRGAKFTGRAGKFGVKLGAGMAVGALGGMMGGLGGRELGHMGSAAGASIIGGNKINKKESPPEQDPQTDPQNSDPVSEPPSNLEDNIAPVNFNSGGTRDADDVIDGRVMQIRNYNQNDLDKMGISNASYERGSLRFSSSGDSQQAQDLRAYAQYLDTLQPAERQQVTDSRGISATQDGDMTRVRINGKAWSAANGGARIDGYTNKKGNSTIQVSSTKDGSPPSLTGGQIMKVNPSEIEGYQTLTRPVTDKDGAVREEKVGQIPLDNMTSTQRGIVSSGEGVTHDEKNMYVPLNKDGKPMNYMQRVSFTAKGRHMQEEQQLKERKTAETQPEQEQPAPVGSPVDQTDPISGEQEQTESPGVPTEQPQTEPKQSPAEQPHSEPPQSPVGQDQAEPIIELPQSPSTDSPIEPPQPTSQAPSPTQPEPAESPAEQQQAKSDNVLDEFAYSELLADDMTQEINEIDSSDFSDDFAG